jgi:TM2 domain-containing membrane protein YozV
MTSALKILLIVIGVVIALSVIGAIISALKWLLILAGIVFIVGLVGSWSRRSTS